MTDGDIETIQAWLRQPHVQDWWKDPTAASRVAEEHRARQTGEDHTEMHVIVWRGSDIGMIQRYRLDDEPDFASAIAASGHTAADAAGIDYAIGAPDQIGHGIGTAVVAAFSADLFAAWPDIQEVVVTPQAANRASCRVLEKAGYQWRWTGMIHSDDPSDAGPAALYVLARHPGDR